MRILMLNHNTKWRGTFFRAFHFARCLARRGHDVTVVTISESNRLRFRTENLQGVRVVESPDLLAGKGRTGWDPYDTIRRTLLALTGETFDIVHAFDCRPAVIVPALALKRFRGVKLVSDWADWWGRGGIIEERGRILRWTMGAVETFFEEFFRPFADGLTVTSRALQDRAAGLGIPRGRIRYIPSGADTETIRPMDKIHSRKLLGLPENGPIVEFIGFVNYDFDCMIRSFPFVQEAFPEATLLLVGQPSPLTPKISKACGITRGIRETGVVPFEKLSVYLACADVLLLPFTDKICNIGRGPIKLGDYMAAGRPIVTQPVGDLRFVFDENEPIGVLAGDTPEEFGRAVCELLANPVRAERLGRNARRLAEERYAWPILAAELERYYEGLLGSADGSAEAAKGRHEP
jgi:glycosyltransferase involved in cell wall biosynthesis